MKNMFTFIIWDIDGTLLDTSSGVYAAIDYTLSSMGESKSREEITRMVHSSTITKAFGEVAGFDSRKTLEAVDIFRTRYMERDILKAKTYPGIIEILRELHSNGVKQAVVSNKRDDCAKKICSHFKIDAYCSPIIGADRYNSLSKKDLLSRCLGKLNCKTPQDAIQIGDTEGDKQAAEEAGVGFLGVNYGYGFQNVLGYANSPAELLSSLQTYNFKDCSSNMKSI